MVNRSRRRHPLGTRRSAQFGGRILSAPKSELIDQFQAVIRKEWLESGSRLGVYAAIAGLPFALNASAPLLRHLLRHRPLDHFEPIQFILLAVSSGLPSVLLGIDLIVGERERATFDTLLASKIDGTALFLGKIAVGWLRVLVISSWIVVVPFVVGLFVDSLAQIGSLCADLIGVAIMCALFALLAIVLSTLITLRCRRSQDIWLPLFISVVVQMGLFFAFSRICGPALIKWLSEHPFSNQAKYAAIDCTLLVLNIGLLLLGCRLFRRSYLTDL